MNDDGGTASADDFSFSVNGASAQAFEAEGADAWYTSDPKRFLGNSYNPDDYEQVKDIVKTGGMSNPPLLNPQQWLVYETSYAKGGDPAEIAAAINRLLDDFEGKLTSSKYAKLAKCSEDTALRDIKTLVERGVLVKNEAGGRSTSYRLCTGPVLHRP